MKYLYISLLFAFAINLQAQAEESVAENTDVVESATTFKFPPWPEAAASGLPDSDFVPPPPGPYMSSALSAVGNGFDLGSAPRSEPAEAAIVKPDMAWPERRFAPPPERWIPENGYHYAPADEVKPSPLARQPRQAYPRAPQYMQPPYGWGPAPAQPWADGRYTPPPGSGY